MTEPLHLARRSTAPLDKVEISNQLCDLEHIVRSEPPRHPAPALLILDISRLVYAAWSRTPTGIPRVELAYAEHYIATEPDRLRFAVLDAFGRLRIVDARLAVGFVREIAGYWEGNVASVRAYLRVALRAIWIHLLLMLRPWGALRRLVAAHAGRSLYVIPSQLQLEHSSLIEGLKTAGDLKLVYFVHDILPSLLPAYFPDDAEDRNRRRMENAARLADAIIVNSQATALSFKGRFGRNLAPGKLVVAPLGVTLGKDAGTSGRSPAGPYFVMVGTIEPRKNHLLVLNLWRDLYAEFGQETPRLLLVGSRGWKNHDIIEMIERNAPPRGMVEELGRLPDAAVAGLLKGARALLLPSFAEGYGLPLAEALSHGTPVLCSDLPVFHEVGAGIPDYLAPTAPEAWRAAVLDYAGAHSPRRDAQLRRLSSWSPPSWARHFAVVDETLRALGK
jgi:glycosyltransferase involved in cell wall biosynthesis